MFLHPFKMLDAGVSYGSPAGQTQDGLNLLSHSAAEVFSYSLCLSTGILFSRQQAGLHSCSASLCRY